jgi:phage terminase large subunit
LLSQAVVPWVLSRLGRCDEASGIAEPVFEAAAGSMSSAGATTILIGNPARNSGFFWRTHAMERDRMDSNAYRIRVLGEFPSAADNTLIGAELFDSAMLLDVQIDLAQAEIWGVDVARFGDDSSTLVKRRGRVVPEMPRSWRQFDTMQLAGAIKAEWDMSPNNHPALISARTSRAEPPEAILVEYFPYTR